MKQKIKDQLKTKYSNLGFGDKEFDGMSEYISQTITEESQIENAITGVKGLLTAFQGGADQLRSKNTTLQKEIDELKAKGGDTTPVEPPKPNEPMDINALVAKAVADALTPVTAELTAAKEAQAIQARANYINSLVEKHKIPAKRVEEGFDFTGCTDDASIEAKMIKISENCTAQSLGGRPSFAVDVNQKPSTEQLDSIINKM